MFRSALWFLAALLGVACTTSQQQLPTYAAEVEAYLEPFDDQNFCRLHVALRNTSGVRQGFSDFQISWEADGQKLPDTRLQHNTMRVGMLRNASADLPLKCLQIKQMRVSSAVWELFEGWDNENPRRVRIEGADATTWTFAYSEALEVWVGTRETS